MASKKAIVENNTVRRICYNSSFGAQAFGIILWSLEIPGTVVFRNNSVTECGTAIYAPHDSLSVRLQRLLGEFTVADAVDRRLGGE